MVRDSGAIASLKKFVRDKIGPLDPTEVMGELTGASDRAIVITLVAYLDDALEFRLAKSMRKMNQKDHEHAFRFDGPIGSFSSRIEMCYLLELIDNETRERLHDLREMRNACAHSKKPISLNNPVLLNVAKRVLKDGIFKPSNQTSESIRHAFVSECLFLFNVTVTSKDQSLKMLKISFAKALTSPKT